MHLLNLNQVQGNCDDSCLLCNGPLITNCLSCDPISNRENVDGQCICQSGFYQQQGEILCHPCPIECQACVLGANSQLECLSCVGNRTLNQSGNCNCMTPLTEQLHKVQCVPYDANITSDTIAMEAYDAEKGVQGLNFFLIMVYLFTIACGGFTFLWSILDIYTWVINFYFINVRYPLNVENFFYRISWAQVIFLSNPIELNSESDSYYLQTPEKFKHKGQDSLFINSIWYDLYALGIALLIYPLCKVLINTFNPPKFDNTQFPQRERIKRTLSPITIQATLMNKPFQPELKNKHVGTVALHPQIIGLPKSIDVKTQWKQCSLKCINSPSGDQLVQSNLIGSSQDKVENSESRFQFQYDSRMDITAPKTPTFQEAINVHTPNNIIQKQVESFYSRLQNYIVNTSNMYLKAFPGVIMKVFYLTFLDFELASLLQLQQSHFRRHWIVTLNVVGSILFQTFSLFYIYKYYKITSKSSRLLKNQRYKSKYGLLYVHLDVDGGNMALYSVFAILKKKMFIFFLVFFQYHPLWQTMLCASSTLLNALLIAYQNPFDSRILMHKELFSELGIFLTLSGTIIYAMRDNNSNDEHVYSYIGWGMISILVLVLLLEIIEILISLYYELKVKYKTLRWIICGIQDSLEDKE